MSEDLSIQIHQIEELLEEFESALSEHRLTKIQKQLDGLVSRLEEEFPEGYGYFQYILAQRYLKKLPLNEKKKNMYKKRLLTFQIEYESHLKRLHDKKNQEIENEIKEEGMLIEESLQRIKNLIKQLQSIPQEVRDSLTNQIQLLDQIVVTSSVPKFQINNQQFKEIFLEIDQCEVVLIDHKEESQNITYNKESQDDFTNNEQIISEQLETIETIKSLYSQYIDYKHLSFFKIIYEDSQFKDQYYGNPILDLLSFGEKNKLILKIISPDKYYNFFHTSQYKEEVLIYMRELVVRNQNWKREAEHEENIREGQKSSFQRIQDYENYAKIFFVQANTLTKQIRTMDTNSPHKNDLNQQKDLALKQCYEYYRMAMKHSDKDSIFFEQSVINRNNLSLALYLKGDYILAQIYAIGALHIIKQYENHPKAPSLLLDSQKVLDKIKGKFQNPQSSEQESQPQEQSIHALQIYGGNQGSQITRQRQQLKLLIKEEFNNLKLDCFNQIIQVRYEQSGEYDLNNYLQFENNTITTAKSRAMKGKILAGAFTALTVTASELFFVAVVGIPTFGFFTLLIAPFLIFDTTQKVKQIKKEIQKFNSIQQTRVELNQIVQNAINLHKQARYYEFLKELAKPYLEEPKKVLIELQEGDYGLSLIDNNYIQTLLENGFRPDAIAYLLILTGEAILLCQFSNPQYYADQKKIAYDIYLKVAQNLSLLSQAKKIDALIAKQISKKIFRQQEGFWTRLANTFDITGGQNVTELLQEDMTIDSKYSIAYQDTEREQYDSYEQRVNEIQDIASVNICLIHILNNDLKEAIDIAKIIIKKRQQHYCYYQQSEDKINALIDLLEILCPTKEIFQLESGNGHSQENNQTCPLVEKLRACVQSDQLKRAKEIINSALLDNCQNIKSFYFWCAICFDKLSNSKAALFYVQKYAIQQGRNQNEEKVIENIKQKYS